MLTPDHGYPVRVIIPGGIGARMIKWLSEIVVSDTESDNWYHENDNKVLPAGVDEERAVKEGETVSASVVLLKEYYHMIHFCLVLFSTCHCASMQTFQTNCCFKPKSGFRCHCQNTLPSYEVQSIKRLLQCNASSNSCCHTASHWANSYVHCMQNSQCC